MKRAMATPSSRMSVVAAPAGTRRAWTFGSLERKRSLVSGAATNHTAAVAAPRTSNAANPNQIQRWSPESSPNVEAGAGVGAPAGGGGGGSAVDEGGGESCPCCVLTGYCDQSRSRG